MRAVARSSTLREWSIDELEELELLVKEAKASDEEKKSELCDWLGFRRELSSDRWELLQFFCAVSGYEPLPHLIDVHLAAPDDRELIAHKLLLGGIGGGKTHCAMSELAMAVIANPGGWFLAAAPTYDQAVNVLKPHWDRIADAFESAGYPLQKRWDNQLQMAVLDCGGRLFLRTYSKIGNLLGFEFTAANLTELDTIPRPMAVWDAIKGRIRRPGAMWRQLMGDTTPRGMQGATELFYRTREELKAAGDEQGLLQWYWSRALGRDNPHLPKDYLPSLRQSYSNRQWRQEVEAEILQPDTAVWSEFGREQHGCRFVFSPQHPYDLAYDAGDQFPHVLWIQRLPWADVIFDELCPDQWPITKLHEEIVRRCSALGRQPEVGVGDRAVKSELAWLADAFPRMSVRRMVSRHEQSVSEGIELVRARLDPLDGPPRLLVADYLFDRPPRRGIVNCLSQYRYKMRSDGTLTNEPWKNNIHDHGADATRMHQTALHGTEFAAFNVSRSH